MRVLETFYRGYRFRSRLEARWAVFMDSLAVKFVYEPEAFELGGVSYLPDFWVPHIKSFIEIKPEHPNEDEQYKAEKLCEFTKENVFIIYGQPEVNESSDSALFFQWYTCRGFDDEIIGDVYGDVNYLWCECPYCHRFELQFQGRADRISCLCRKSSHGDRGHNYASPCLQKAYSNAKSYRFEPKSQGRFQP